MIAASIEVRHLVVGICGVVVALLAITVGGALVLRMSGVDDLMREARFGIEGQAITGAIHEGRDPATALRTGLQAFDFVVLPGAVLAAGILIGLLARGRMWPPLAIAMAPLLIAFVAGRAWSPRACVFAGCYLLLAGTGAHASRRLRPNSSG